VLCCIPEVWGFFAGLGAEIALDGASRGARLSQWLLANQNSVAMCKTPLDLCIMQFFFAN
jgi:hypothetical protein